MSCKGCCCKKRRGFVKSLAALLISCFLPSCNSGQHRPTGGKFKLTELSKLKEGVNEFGLERIAVIKQGETLKAVSLLCTHQTCLLNIAQTNVANMKFICPCHGSEFDAAGAVIKGPATQNLPWYKVAVVEGYVEVDTKV